MLDLFQFANGINYQFKLYPLFQSNKAWEKISSSVFWDKQELQCSDLAPKITELKVKQLGSCCLGLKSLQMCCTACHYIERFSALSGKNTTGALQVRTALWHALSSINEYTIAWQGNEFVSGIVGLLKLYLVSLSRQSSRRGPGSW